MQSISTIGLDIAKSVFQVHGVDAAGRVVILAEAEIIEKRSAAEEARWEKERERLQAALRRARE